LSTPRPGYFNPGKDAVPTVLEAGWAPGLVWAGAENLSHTGIRFPDRPARSQSLYRLRYTALNMSYLSKFDFTIAVSICEQQSTNPHTLLASRSILHECLYDLHLLADRNSSKIDIYLPLPYKNASHNRFLPQTHNAPIRHVEPTAGTSDQLPHRSHTVASQSSNRAE
jgi:hypothetical protein